jgi:predicted nuclease of predicted toxin-antitoxin system
MSYFCGRTRTSFESGGMKLLFDENLSFKLARLLAAKFPGSQHVRDVGLKGRADGDIWNFAKANSFVIVSKDKDFYQRALFYGAPPKFVWLCIGNCVRQDLLALIERHEQDILAFESSSESVLIVS